MTRNESAHGGPAVALDQLEVAPLAGRDRHDLRAQVAERLLGQAHVHGDDVDQLLVDLAAAAVLHDGDLDPLGVDVGRDRAERAAHVEPVRHAAGEADQLPLVEDRHGEGEVVEVAAGRVGVVGDEDVAGVDVLVAVVLDLRAHRLGHAADEHRQAKPDRERLALLREQADGEVQRLVDDEVVGGPRQVGLHLLGDRDEASADDLDRDGVHGRGCAGWCRSSRFAPDRDQQVAGGVDLQRVAGGQHGGGGALLDQGRPRDAVARPQPVAQVDRRVHQAAEIDRLAPAQRRAVGLRPALGDGVAGRLAHDPASRSRGG